MANHLNVALSVHATSAVNTVERITFSNNYEAVEIKNRDATTDIYFCLGPNNPTVGGADTYIVQAGKSTLINNDWAGDELRLIASAATLYSVTGINRLS